MNALPPENLYGHTKKLAFILEQLSGLRQRLGREVSVLDFGCGNGEAVGRYLISSGAGYVGVDGHPESLAHARARFGSLTARFSESVPSDVAFDALVYADVLEHLHEPREFLSAHVERLRPGGLVLGSIPNGYGPYEIEMALARKSGLLALAEWAGRAVARPAASAVPPYNSESGHVQFFTRASFTRLLSDSGLELAAWRHGAFVCGSLTAGLVPARFRQANLRAADVLPSWMVSTWLFAARKTAP